MKKVYFLVAVTLFFASIGHAQITADVVEQMMTKRAITCQDVEFNAVSMIPRLYNEGKWDTLDAVLDYTGRYCGTYEFMVTLEMLRSIKNNSFKEEITDLYGVKNPPVRQERASFYRKNILAYLHSYREGVDILYNAPNYFNYTVKAYNDYYAFIHNLAASLVSKPGLSPVEQFLVRYYTAPDTLMFAELADTIYKGTQIYAAYSAQTDNGGLTYALTAGMWSPQGHMAVLGNHPYVGMQAGSKSHNYFFDLEAQFRFINSTQSHTILFDDTLHDSKRYFAMFLGGDIGYSFVHTKHSELEMLIGFAYDFVDLWPNPNYDKSNTSYPDKTVGTLNFNAGMQYKLYLKHAANSNIETRSYIGLQARYNFMNYQNTGGTDLRGSALTVGVIWGGILKPVHHYYSNE